MKTIQMEVKTTNKRDGAEIVIKRQATLKAEDLSFKHLTDFLKDVERIDGMLKGAVKNGAFVEFEICTYTYTLDEKGYFVKMLSDTFNRWYYRGYPQYDHCDLDNGIIAYHLQPDVRYTPDYHDMVYDYNIASLTA